MTSQNKTFRNSNSLLADKKEDAFYYFHFILLLKISARRLIIIFPFFLFPTASYAIINSDSLHNLFVSKRNFEVSTIPFSINTNSIFCNNQIRKNKNFSANRRTINYIFPIQKKNLPIVAKNFLNNEYYVFKPAQKNDSLKIHPWRIAIVASTLPLATASVFYYFQNAWWRDTLIKHNLPSPKFHFDDSKELKYALLLDKSAHFWSTQVASHIFGGLLEWSGFDEKHAACYGAAFAIVTSGIVEVKDGLAPWWGFSLTDMSANILGSLYPVLQTYYPIFKNINIKWSYNPYKKSNWRSIPWNANKSFLDDYERHTFWITANIHNLLPPNARRFFPSFINIDTGVSAILIDGKGAGKREYSIGIDLDLNELYFGKKKGLKKTINVLDKVRLPSPSLKVYPDRYISFM